MPDETFHSDKPGKPVTRPSQSASGGPVRRWVVVRHSTIWHPPTDVYELEDHLVVIVEIAGMRDHDFSVVLHGQRLTISGVRQSPGIPPDGAYHQLEIPYGEFRTEVMLPRPVLSDAVTAEYRDGFLRIEIPNAPAQRIQIVNMDLSDSNEEASESNSQASREE